MFTDKLLATITGLAPSTVRQLVHQGSIKPDGPPVRRWTYQPTLALAVRINARRAGATQAAADRAFHILASSDIEKLREDIDGGFRYLRLMGDVCDERLVTREAALNLKLLQAATETRTAYTVVDVGYWVAKIDAALAELQEAQEETEECPTC